MTTIDHRPDAVSPGLAHAADTSGRVIGQARQWLITADHKQIGKSFIIDSLIMGVGALVVAFLLGLERTNPDDSLLDGDSVAQLFSLHRVGVAFLVLTPLLLGITLAVAPLQVGSRRAAFGRAAAFGYWAWLAGAVTVVIAYLANGGPGGGDPTMVDVFLLGLGLAVTGLIAVAGAIVVTVLTSRAPGMRLERSPMLAWSGLAGGVALVLSLPVLVGDLVLLTVDHRYSRLAFDGNTGILDWIGWSLGTPAVLALTVPALGMVADIIATSSGRRQPMREGQLIGIAIFSTAALGAVTQIPHLVRWSDASGGDRFADILPYAFFNLLPILGVLVTIAVGGLALRAKPRVTAGLAFGLLGGLCLLAGTVASALTPILDLQLDGSVYEEGTFVLVTYGALLAGLGGVAHWGPKLWGRRMADRQTLPLAGLGFVGVMAASLPMLLAGFQGQPAMAAGGFDYELAPEALNGISMVGQGLVAVAMVLFALLALRSFSRGEAAGDDPWDGQTLEWATSSPPPDANFTDLHTVSSAEPLLDLKPARSDA